ncbi:hypothetical protein GHNINEIG_01072 [Hydrogenovibrio crunogenus]|uniref:Uncharacterized protein n=1 Tax=Hydrogenovibrio crunogenus TaxID=39765 RepID=A0A4P7NYZ1_9GAMM|nr:hypothetical protein [Hydrogenovibrio crunogenus]QBZ83031.1 hypothetical protein GHNINEIG_01072 [Hydrogenovibrio crunogenus]
MNESIFTDYAVVAVGSTEQEKFPLILVFGRENNGKAQIIPGISIYDEAISSGSTFWNRTYGFVQRLTTWKGQFRQSCVNVGMSPIVFTNALSKPIPNAQQNKDALRVTIQENDIMSHINGIFDLKLISRVGAVIFSTGNSSVYELSRYEVIKNCLARSIPFIEMPYFATQGRKNEELDQAINDENAAIIKNIINEFKTYTQKVVPADAGKRHG